jgi:hypothetical protein
MYHSIKKTNDTNDIWSTFCSKINANYIFQQLRLLISISPIENYYLVLN